MSDPEVKSGKKPTKRQRRKAAKRTAGNEKTEAEPERKQERERKDNATTQSAPVPIAPHDEPNPEPLNVSEFTLTNEQTRSGRTVLPVWKYGMPNVNAYDASAEEEENKLTKQNIVHYANVVISDSEPKTYEEAKNSTQAKDWNEAMKSEIKAMYDNESWTLVKRTPHMNVIGSKWVYKIKRKGDGTIERYKARLVARGFSQVEGVDYNETFAPVMRYKTLRIILSLATQMDYEVKQMDVMNAFLNAEVM